MGKSAPSPPPAPDPMRVAAAEAQYNRINQFTPAGNLIFTNPGQEPAPGTRMGFNQAGLTPAAQQLMGGGQRSGTKGSRMAPPPAMQNMAMDPGQASRMPSGATLQDLQRADLKMPPGQGNMMTPPGQPDMQPNSPNQASSMLSGKGSPMPMSGSNASASATIQLNPALQFLENLRLTSDANMQAGALQRQQLLDPNPIDLGQFDPIQTEIDQSQINFQGPQFDSMPTLPAPDLQNVGTGPDMQTGVQAPDLANALAATPDIQTGINRSGLADIPTDIEAFRGDVEQAVFNRQQRLLDPVFEQRERALRQRLASGGIPVGAEAYQTDLNNFEDARNRAYLDAADQAVITGGSQASRFLGDTLAAQGQDFGQRLAGGQFGNQAAGQALSEALTRGSFQNQSGLQQFGMGLQNAQLGNQARQQMFGNQVQGIGFNNQNQLANLDARSGIRDQLFNEGLGLSAANNAASAQNLGLQQQLLTNQNAGRSQGLNEQAAIRQNQFNELASLLGLQQVQAPTFQNFIQPGQVDVTGAVGLQQQALQNSFNQRNARYNAGMGGLFGLGSAAIMGPMAAK